MTKQAQLFVCNHTHKHGTTLFAVHATNATPAKVRAALIADDPATFEIDDEVEFLEVELAGRIQDLGDLSGVES